VSMQKLARRSVDAVYVLDINAPRRAGHGAETTLQNGEVAEWPWPGKSAGNDPKGLPCDALASCK